MVLLIKASIIVFILLGFYKLVLERESFFAANRMYLLGSLVLAVVLPFIVLPKLVQHQGYIDRLINVQPQVQVNHEPNPSINTLDITTTKNEKENIEAAAKEQASTLPVDQSSVDKSSIASQAYIEKRSTLDWIVYIYLFGVAVLLINLIAQVSNVLLKVFRSEDKIVSDEGIIVNVAKHIEPCSFFKYIFINPASYDYDTYEQIIAHEKIHVSQRHSIDLLLSELAVILLWFNPFAWLLRREVEKNIEYQTDDALVHQNKAEKQSYQLNLVKIACHTQPLAVTTNYNQSLIKQRILKMNGKRSHKFNYWKYAFLLPLLFVLALGLNAPQEAEAHVINELQNMFDSPTTTNEEIPVSIDTTASKRVNDSKEKPAPPTASKKIQHANLAKKDMSNIITDCKEFEEAVARGDLKRVKEILKTLDPDCLKVRKTDGNNLSNLQKMVDQKKQTLKQETKDGAVVIKPKSSTCIAVQSALEESNELELIRLFKSKEINCFNDGRSYDVEILQGLMHYDARISIDINKVIHVSRIGFTIDVKGYEEYDCKDANYIKLAQAILTKNIYEIRRILSQEDLSCPLNTDGITNDFPFIKKLMNYKPTIEYHGNDAITVYGSGIEIDLYKGEKNQDNKKGVDKVYMISDEDPRTIIDIEALIKKGKEDIDQLNCLDLIDVVDFGNHELARTLLKKLNPNCFHRMTETTTGPDNQRTKTSFVITPLILAAANGDQPMVNLLLSGGAKINFDGGGSVTPLMHGIQSGNIELVKLLVHHGANIHAADEDGNKVIDYATAYGGEKITRYLKSIGAKARK